MELLVTGAQAQTNTVIPKSLAVADSKMVTLIESTQLRDIKPLLGEEMYWDMIGDPTRTTSGRNYPALLDETEYTYDGIVYTNPGLRAVMYQIISARYLTFGQTFSTPSGVKESRNKNEKPNTGQIKRQANEHYAFAKDLWKEVRKYLERVDGTSDEFTHWSGSDVQINIQPGAINRVTLL